MGNFWRVFSKIEKKKKSKTTKHEEIEFHDSIQD